MVAITRNQLDDEVARGHLLSPFPRAYCRPWDGEHLPVLRRAALASVGDPVALSHTTALAVWRLRCPASSALHVTVPIGRHPVGRTPGLIVHRTRTPTRIRTAERMRVVEPAAAIVRSWPLLDPSERRSPAIEAIRRGLVGPDRLAEVCSRAVGMRGRSQLGRLIALLASGCESELEIWGLLSVFDVPGLRHGVRQRVVRAGGRSYRLDLAYEAERVAVEMDGERWHSNPEQRESDRQRDAALAAAGWLTLRFSWQRLHFDVAGCRRDTLATLAERRAWRRNG